MPTIQAHLQNVHDAIFSQTAEHVTTGVAAIVAVNHIWRDNVHDMAGVAADLGQILGMTWIAIQIVGRLVSWGARLIRFLRSVA